MLQVIFRPAADRSPGRLWLVRKTPARARRALHSGSRSRHQ